MLARLLLLIPWQEFDECSLGKNVMSVAAAVHHAGLACLVSLRAYFLDHERWEEEALGRALIMPLVQCATSHASACVLNVIYHCM